MIKWSRYLYSGIGDNKSARAVIYQFTTSGGGANQEQKYNEDNFHLQPNSFQKVQKVCKQPDWSLLNIFANGGIGTPHSAETKLDKTTCNRV